LLKIRKKASTGGLGRRRVDRRRRVPQRHVAQSSIMENTEEDVSVEEEARRMMEMFGRELWDIFPRGRRGNGYLVERVELSELGLEDFQGERVMELINRPYVVLESNWRARFDTYFPTAILRAGHANVRWKQGWERLRYIERYMQWMSQSEEIMERIRTAMYAIFSQLKYLPNSQRNGKVWQTRKPKGSQDTHVYLIVNDSIQ